MRQPLAAVVVGEDDDGVPAEVETVERRQDAPDAGIDPLDHRDVVGPGVGVGVERRHVLAAIAGGRWLIRPLIGPVRRVVGHVDEDGARAVLLEDADGAIGDQVGHVAGDLDRPIVLEQIGVHRRVGAGGVLVVVDEAALEPEELVEAMGVRAVLRLPPEMPFPDEGGVVAGAFEQPRQRRRGRGEPALRILLRPDAERRLERVALLVAAADQAGARRRAGGAVGVEVGEPDAVPRQAVDVRRLDVRRAVDAEVAVAGVVRHDQDDVRAVRRRRSRGLPDRRRTGPQGQGEDDRETHHERAHGTLRSDCR